MLLVLTSVFLLGASLSLPLLVLPTGARRILIRNCHDYRERWKLGYAIEEYTALLRGFSSLMLMAVLVGAGLATGLVLFDHYVMSVDIAAACLWNFDIQPEAWMTNIQSSATGNAQHLHHLDRFTHGYSQEQTRAIQEFLWIAFPCLVGGCLMFALAVLVWGGKIFQHQIRDWAIQAEVRRRIRLQRELFRGANE